MNYVYIRERALVAAVLIVCPQLAFAYIDPGTGSILLQGLLAGVAGAAVVIKLYWFRIKNFFLRKSSDSPSLEPDSVSKNSAESQAKENQG